jgi:hypothetical protein
MSYILLKFRKKILTCGSVARPRLRSKKLYNNIFYVMACKLQQRNFIFCAVRADGCSPNKGTATEELCFSVRPYVLEWVSGVEWVGWWVSEPVSGVLIFSPCEVLLLESGSWETGTVREPRGRGTSAFESRYQATTVKTWLWTLVNVCVIVTCKV